MLLLRLLGHGVKRLVKGQAGAHQGGQLASHQYPIKALQAS